MADDKFNGDGGVFNGDDDIAFDDDDIEFIDDLDDEYDLDDLESLGFEDVAEAIGLPDELPALRLPPLATLAESARATELPATLARLAAWVGADGRSVTDEGDLEADDAAEAASAAGVDAGELAYLWEYALTSDWVAFDDEDDEDDEDEDDDAGYGEDHVSRGETADLWESADAEDLLEAWRATFVSVLSGTFDVIGDTAPEEAADMDLDGRASRWRSCCSCRGARDWH